MGDRHLAPLGLVADPARADVRNSPYTLEEWRLPQTKVRNDSQHDHTRYGDIPRWFFAK